MNYKNDKHDLQRWFALIAATAGLILIIIMVYSNYSILTANETNLQNELSAYNVSAANQLLIMAGMTALKDAVFLFVPLMVISDFFLFVSFFIYMKDEEREKRIVGGIMTIVFAILPLLGLLIFLPFSPLTVLTVISYLGVFTTNALYQIGAYLLFMIFFIFGLTSGLITLYRYRKG
ncbi:MAG: hypothetical protein RAK22_00720 [Nanoarchaeota archaeon]|nr:hypothetical protein [Nanoarchaeota archaeon]